MLTSPLFRVLKPLNWSLKLFDRCLSSDPGSSPVRLLGRGPISSATATCRPLGSSRRHFNVHLGSSCIAEPLETIPLIDFPSVSQLRQLHAPERTASLSSPTKLSPGKHSSERSSPQIPPFSPRPTTATEEVRLSVCSLHLQHCVSPPLQF